MSTATTIGVGRWKQPISAPAVCGVLVPLNRKKQTPSAGIEVELIVIKKFVENDCFVLILKRATAVQTPPVASFVRESVEPNRINTFPKEGTFP